MPRSRSACGLWNRFRTPESRAGTTEKRHMWVDEDGQPALLASVTVTGSNASTGASEEIDYNEDYD